jgi:hypothetical protein
LPAWPHIQVIEVFSVDQHVGDNLVSGPSDPPRGAPIADDASKPIPRLVIGVRSAQVGHARGQVDFRNRSRVARFSLLNFDALSHSPPPARNPVQTTR